MRMHLILCFLLLAPAFLGQSISPKDAAAKLSPGAYYWDGASWTPMKIITASRSTTKHWKRMFVPGLMPQIFREYHQPHALIQINGGTPLFCVKFTGSEVLTEPSGESRKPTGDDIIIVRFDQVKDHRELPVTSGGNMATFKATLKKERLPTTVTELDVDTYIVSPKVALSSGEYLLTTSPFAAQGFDFGFRAESVTKARDSMHK